MGPMQHFYIITVSLIGTKNYKYNKFMVKKRQRGIVQKDEYNQKISLAEWQHTAVH